jgi:hypothetical protein
MPSNSLEILANSLTPTYLYQILMVAKYQNEMYEQYVNIEVLMEPTIPKLILK